MIMAQGQALGHGWPHTAEVAGDALADRLQCLPPACAGGGMGANVLARAMIHGDKHIGAPLAGGNSLGHVGAPDLVDPVGDDGARMGMCVALDRALRREQSVFLHDPPHPPRCRPHSLRPQPRPDLAIALAGKGRGGDHGLDVELQLGVTAGALWAAPPWWARRIGGPSTGGRTTTAVDRCPGHAPDPADAGHTKAAVRGDRMRPTHFFDLRRAKGRPPSSLSILAYNNSLSMVISPTLACSRAISSSRASRSRSLSALSALIRTLSRHSVRRCTGTFKSRETASRLSPRISR